MTMCRQKLWRRTLYAVEGRCGVGHTVCCRGEMWGKTHCVLWRGGVGQDALCAVGESYEAEHRVCSKWELWLPSPSLLLFTEAA